MDTGSTKMLFVTSTFLYVAASSEVQAQYICKSHCQYPVRFISMSTDDSLLR